MKLRSAALTRAGGRESTTHQLPIRAGVDHRKGARPASPHLEQAFDQLAEMALPHIQLGSGVRYDLAEVEEFIRSKRRLCSHVERQKRRKALAAK